MKALTGLVSLVFLVAWPEFARADVLNLACTEVSSADWAGEGCAPNCRTVAVAIDLSGGTITIPAGMAETYPGSYAATITDSAIAWSTEHFDFELSRYTGVLHQRADPKHGQMIAASYDWKCSPVQRQF